MGGCCFTPKKTQLLWWYWLLLFSIVGIPMFLAARYIRDAARHGVVEAWEVRCASRIFWLGSCFSLAVFFALLVFFGYGGLKSPWLEWLERCGDLLVFAGGFLFWLAVAVGAAKLTEKTQPGYARVAVVACCAVIPAAVTWLPYALLSSHPQDAAGLMPVGVMKFLACMWPAHYWYRFTVSPGAKQAWLFLATLAVGTLLFWAAGRYGEAVHAALRHGLTATGTGFYRN